MSKPRKKQGNLDFRHRVSVPAPGSEEIESRLFELISPGTFTNLKGVKDKERSLRSRILTLLTHNNFQHRKFVNYTADVGELRTHFY